MSRRFWVAMPAGALGLCLFAWLACTAGVRPLRLPDEGRYAGVAWEMLSAGHWAVPTLDGLPYFHKPPLFYWIAAAAMRVLGVSEFAVRLPSLLGALISGLGLYLFARRWSSEVHARWAVAVLATQPFFHLGAQFANLDMLVAGCITATVLLAAHAALLVEQERPYRLPLLGAYAMAAAGLMAKGLIGVVLPAAVLVLWLLLARRPRALLRLVSVPGIALFLLLGLPWFVEMQRRYPGFFDYFVIYHHFQRYSQGVFNNQQGAWFYPVALVLATLPSSLLLVRAVKLRPLERAPLPLTPLMWTWFAVVVVFFSVPKSKLLGYVLPALPPLAWLLGWAVRAALERPLWRHAVLALGAGASLAVVAVLALSPGDSSQSLGLALRGARTAGEPVVFLNRHPFDLSFYARLESPVRVMGHWRPEDIVQRDDWRNELFDAGRFDPAASQDRLLSAQGLPAFLCRSGTAWLVGTRSEVAALPLNGAVEETAHGPKYSVWRVQPKNLACSRP